MFLCVLKRPYPMGLINPDQPSFSSICPAPRGTKKRWPLKAGEEGKTYFELSFDKPGWVNGEVRLSGDRLAYDDIFYFPLKIRDKVKVLVVDGDPRTSLGPVRAIIWSMPFIPGRRKALHF